MLVTRCERVFFFIRSGFVQMKIAFHQKNGSELHNALFLEGYEC